MNTSEPIAPPASGPTRADASALTQHIELCAATRVTMSVLPAGRQEMNPFENIPLQRYFGWREIPRAAITGK